MGELGGIPAHHHRPYPIARAQFKVGVGLGDGAQELVGLLDQQAAAVTGLAIGVDTPPVRHAGEGLYAGFQKPMARLALKVGNQPETAVVFEFV